MNDSTVSQIKIANFFQSKLLEILNNHGVTHKEFLTPVEAQKVFGLCDNSLRKVREKNPNIQLYQFPGLKNRYFKYEELLNALQPVGKGGAQ